MKIETIEVVIKKAHADKYGHVNYKKYLDVFCIGQDDFAKKRGISFSEIEKLYGFRSVVRQINIEYLEQVFPSEKVRIGTQIERIGNTSFSYKQEILRAERVITRLSVTIVMIDKSGKPVSIPQDVRIKMC